MMTRNERLVIGLAFAIAVTNFLFMGMGLLHYVCLLAILVVCARSIIRWYTHRQAAAAH